MKDLFMNQRIGPTTRLSLKDQKRILKWWKRKLLSYLQGNGLDPRQRRNQKIAKRLKSMAAKIRIGEIEPDSGVLCLSLVMSRKHWNLMLEANSLDQWFGLPFSELARFRGEVVIGLKPDEFVTIFGKREEREDSILLTFRVQENARLS